jgi:hypothetical protein
MLHVAWGTDGNYKSSSAYFCITGIGRVKMPFKINRRAYPVSHSVNCGPVFGGGPNLQIARKCFI